jgi:hypothetical protein
LKIPHSIRKDLFDLFLRQLGQILEVPLHGVVSEVSFLDLAISLEDSAFTTSLISFKVAAVYLVKIRVIENTNSVLHTITDCT